MEMSSADIVQFDLLNNGHTIVQGLKGFLSHPIGIIILPAKWHLGRGGFGDTLQVQEDLLFSNSDHGILIMALETARLARGPMDINRGLASSLTDELGVQAKAK
ncbi:hypothetical protein Ancab_025155 [Ancistrocladus abbreviatus]